MPNERGQKPVVHTKKHVARLERERRQTRLILYSFIGILVVTVGLLVYGYLDITYFQLLQPVAKVGNAEITTREFQAQVRLQRSNMLNTYQQYSQFGQMFGMDFSSQLQQIQSQLDDTQGLGQTVLDQMINNELILQEAAKRGITVSDAQLESEIQGGYNYYPSGSPTPTITPTEVTEPTLSSDVLKYVTATATQTPTPAGTSTPGETPTATVVLGPTSTGTLQPSSTPTATETLTPTAAATATETPGPTATASPTNTPYTLQGFQQQYQKSLTQLDKMGLTEAQYRELYKVNMLRDQLYAIVTANVPHDQQQAWAREIVVADEATAKKVIDRLNNGEDFGKVAAEVSQDTASATQGGDLGWFAKGAKDAAIDQAAFSLPIGQISQPIQISNSHYAILQVIARQDHVLTADEYKTATDTAFNDFLTKLRDTYGVTTYDYWKDRVPTEPSLSSIATQAALTQQP